MRSSETKHKLARAEMRITSGNRVTIPKRFRERLGLEPGDSVAFDVKDGYAILRAVKTSPDDYYSHEK